MVLWSCSSQINAFLLCSSSWAAVYSAATEMSLQEDAPGVMHAEEEERQLWTPRKVFVATAIVSQLRDWLFFLFFDELPAIMFPGRSRINLPRKAGVVGVPGEGYLASIMSCRLILVICSIFDFAC